MTNNSPYATTSKLTLILALTLGALPALFLLITSTAFLLEGEFVLDVKRLLQVFLLLTLFATTASNQGLRDAFCEQVSKIPGWVLILSGFIILVGMVSSFLNATSTVHAFYSLADVALLIMFVAASLVIAACRQIAGILFDQVIISLLAFMVIAVGIQELIGVVAIANENLEYYSYIGFIHFSHPRFFNQLQSWTLPALAAIPLVFSFSKSEMLRNKWFSGLVCLVALALYWCLMLMSGGRGVVLCLLTSFVVCLLIFPATRLVALRWHLPGLVLGIVMFFGAAQISQQSLLVGQAEKIPKAQNTLVGDSENQELSKAAPASEGRLMKQSVAGRLSLHSSGRTRLWRDSIDEIRKLPFLGRGPMNYACEGRDSRPAHPHNFALQFTGEWGLPAILMLIPILIYLAIIIWRKQIRLGTSYEGKLGGLLTLSLVAAASYSLLSGILIMPSSQVAGILVCGWILGLTKPSDSPSKSSQKIPALLLAFFVLTSAATTMFTVAEFGKREIRELLIAPADQLKPRYWQQGKICKYLD